MFLKLKSWELRQEFDFMVMTILGLSTSHLGVPEGKLVLIQHLSPLLILSTYYLFESHGFGKREIKIRELFHPGFSPQMPSRHQPG